MKRGRRTIERGTVALACGLLATGVSAVASEPPAGGPAMASSGGIYVTTLPAGADIWLDGTYVGRAPVLVDALLPGHHALTITHTGWLVQQVDVTVPPGGVTMSSTRLLAGPHAFAGSAPSGSLVVRETPPGAHLTLDGAPLELSSNRAVQLAAGIHRIGMTTAQGHTTRAFTILPDTATDLVLRPERAAAESRSGVVAPADDYVGADAYTIEGQKIVVRTSGHVVIARFGETSVRYDGATVSYDSAPMTIGGKLYLPLALLQKLSDDMSNAR